ncbi:hypothetical protein E3T43_07140 [Cryobacterium sp. Hh7]|uniref:hypothetical protein n=1 Tax=Cryobacterium sp. Hh7 TaxID=1259159 RepID=UPI00106BCC2A|nr:hypothetical protein [Cryobacterium sp. Hh7]TFD58017.1 hypothetical protein E3T43_07140 [Cryobacterium sp. Hh7]
MSETITITRKGVPTGGYDEGGYPIIGADTIFPVDIIAFAPRGSDESATTAGQKVITGGTVYGFPGLILLSTDRLDIRGETLQVEGESGLWASPYSGESKGIEVAVKRAS